MLLTHGSHILKMKRNSKQLRWLQMTKEAAAVKVSSFLIAHVSSHIKKQGNCLNAWAQPS